MWTLKAKDLTLGLFLAFWAVLAPIHTIIFVVGALVFADLVTGIAKAMRLKQAVTSRRMRETIGKSIAYLVYILVAFGVDHLVEPGGLTIVRAAAVLIGGAEAKSVDENLKDITGFSVWEAFADKLKPKPKSDGGV